MELEHVIILFAAVFTITIIGKIISYFHKKHLNSTYSVSTKFQNAAAITEEYLAKPNFSVITVNISQPVIAFGQYHKIYKLKSPLQYVFSIMLGILKYLFFVMLSAFRIRIHYLGSDARGYLLLTQDQLYIVDYSQDEKKL